MYDERDELKKCSESVNGMNIPHQSLVLLVLHYDFLKGHSLSKTECSEHQWGNRVDHIIFF